jgi:hypothetical protein
MENYTPEWWNKGELADIVRRSRLVTVEANGVYLASIECRHRAAVLRDEAQSAPPMATGAAVVSRPSAVDQKRLRWAGQTVSTNGIR